MISRVSRSWAKIRVESSGVEVVVRLSKMRPTTSARPTAMLMATLNRVSVVGAVNWT